MPRSDSCSKSLPSLGSLHEQRRSCPRDPRARPHRADAGEPGRRARLAIRTGNSTPAIQRRRLWIGVRRRHAVRRRTDSSSILTGDISQASLAAMMIVLGRPLRENEYPDAIATLVSEVIEIAQIRGQRRISHRASKHSCSERCRSPSRKPHANGGGGSRGSSSYRAGNRRQPMPNRADGVRRRHEPCDRGRTRTRQNVDAHETDVMRNRRGGR